MHENKFAAENYSGVAGIVSQNVELGRELTIEKRKALGLGKNRYANMLKAPIDIQAHDIKSQNKVSDTCAECPGVVNANYWLGGARIKLWGYNY